MLSPLYILAVSSLLVSQLYGESSEQFSLILILSGSPLQNAGVTISSSNLVLGSSSTNAKYLEGSIQSDGKFKTTDGKYLTLDTDGTLALGSDGVSDFTISSGAFLYNGKGFHACPLPSNGYKLISIAVGTASCDNGYYPSMDAMSESGSFLTDYPESGDSDDSSSSSDSSDTTTEASSASSSSATSSSVTTDDSSESTKSESTKATSTKSSSKATSASSSSAAASSGSSSSTASTQSSNNASPSSYSSFGTVISLAGAVMALL